MKYKITYYRVLELEDEIEADSLEDAKGVAGKYISRLHNSDFSGINEEYAEVIDEGEGSEMQAPERVDSI